MFKCYLLGHACDVYTDHAALRTLMSLRAPAGRMARWVLVLSELRLISLTKNCSQWTNRNETDFN